MLLKNILKLFNISHFASIDRVDLVWSIIWRILSCYYVCYVVNNESLVLATKRSCTVYSWLFPLGAQWSGELVTVLSYLRSSLLCCGTVHFVTISLHFCGRKFLRLLRISVPRIQGSRVDTRTIGEPSWWGGKTHPDWWHRIQTLSLLTDIPPTALCWWVTRECLLWGGGVRPGSHTDHSRDTARCLYSILYTET